MSFPTQPGPVEPTEPGLLARPGYCLSGSKSSRWRGDTVARLLLGKGALGRGSELCCLWSPQGRVEGGLLWINLRQSGSTPLYNRLNRRQKKS